MTFQEKDRCIKVCKHNNRIEKVFKDLKIYVVRAIYANGTMQIYNNPDVVFDTKGNVVKSPPLIGRDSSNWSDCVLVKLTDDTVIKDFKLVR